MLKGRSKQRFKALAEREQQLEAQPLVGRPHAKRAWL